MEIIFISGASGFIGKNLIETILKFNKYKIVAFVSKTDYLGIAQLKKFNIQIINEDNLETYSSKIDYCVHLASYGVSYGDRDVDLMIDVNIKLSVQLMRFCKRNNCKLFVNTGSCFEYGSSIQNRKIIETDILSPEDVYAASKVSCENFLQVYSRVLGIKMITIRPFSIFGKYEKEGRLMPLIFKHGIICKPLSLTPGEQVRDYLDVRDVALSIYLLIENNHKLREGQAVNICSGNGISVKSFIQTIIDVCKFDSANFKFGEKPYRENESMYFVGSKNELNRIVGVLPFEDIERKIMESYEFYKAQSGYYL